MSSRLAQLAVLDVIQVALALALGARGTDMLQRSKEALQAVVEHICRETVQGL